MFDVQMGVSEANEFERLQDSPNYVLSTVDLELISQGVIPKNRNYRRSLRTEIFKCLRFGTPRHEADEIRVVLDFLKAVLLGGTTGKPTRSPTEGFLAFILNVVGDFGEHASLRRHVPAIQGLLSRFPQGVLPESLGGP
jgi:hypothetical protein